MGNELSIVGLGQTIDIHCDCGSIEQIIKAQKDPLFCGVTTNPTLIKQQGVKDYIDFVETAVRYMSRQQVKKYLSIEIVDDHPGTFPGQTHKHIRSIVKKYNFANYVYYKAPFYIGCGNRTEYRDLYPTTVDPHIINQIGGNVNFTAVFHPSQIIDIVDVLRELKYKEESDYIPKFIISIFSGRIADCGYDPEHVFQFARDLIKSVNLDKIHNIKLLWASTREPFNYYQAKRANADIITISPDIMEKLKKAKTKNLISYSKETCEMFYEDIVKANFDKCEYNRE